MGIGTKEIQLKRIENGNLKLSNPTVVQAKKRSESIWFKIFEFVGIAVVATVLAGLGQEWATAGLIALGASEVATDTISATIGATVEFGVQESLDVADHRVNPTNIALNALPFISLLGVAKNALRIRDLLQLAINTGLTAKLTGQEAKSLAVLQEMLSGKRIVAAGNKAYAFGEDVSRSDILSMFSHETQYAGLHAINTNLRNGLDYDAGDVQKLLQMNEILRKLSPQLFSPVEKTYYQQAAMIVKESKLTTKELLNDEAFSNLLLSARTLEGNKSARIIWALYSIRTTASIQSRISTHIVELYKKVNRYMRLLDPLTLIDHVMDRIVEEVVDHVREALLEVKWIKKSVRWTKNKYKWMVDKVNTQLHRDERDAEDEVSRVLIPVNSKWILGYKVKPMIDGTFAVIIYFQKTKYKPRTFFWDAAMFKRWVIACKRDRAGEFYKQYLELGYHLHLHGLGSMLKFFPPVLTEFFKEGIRTFDYIRTMDRNITKMKQDGIVPTVEERAKDKAIERFSEEVASMIFLSPIAKRAVLEAVRSRGNISEMGREIINERLRDRVQEYRDRHFRKIR